ncbi:MAG: acyl-CoA mutase large subunit family protein [bacterium JZ-2024 1]
MKSSRKSDREVGERPQEFFTASGIRIEPLYTADYLRQFDPARDLGKPGEPPFTRGIYPTMYRGRLWTMRQYAGFGTAQETNRRFRLLLRQGQTGLSIAFDLPTQLGLDSDHPLAEGEVGKTGVAISSIRDFAVLLDEIPLDRVSISMTINATAPVLLAMLLVLAEERGVSWNLLRGTVQNDILKEYIARGNYIYPPEASLRLCTDLIAFCAEHVPRWHPISVSGYHFREKGATAVQEVGFTFANAITYINWAIDRGIAGERFARSLSFFFAAYTDVLEEIAKFRAARRLWAKITHERWGFTDPEARALRFHTQTAGSTLTWQQPLNNTVRVTLQALAAVLGGTQSLHTNAFDEALALPTELSALIALRTQQIIAYESGVPSVIDPLAGSYYIEWLTNTLEDHIRGLIARVDRLGGMVPAIRARFPQTEIENSAYEYQRKVESQEAIVVGVNRFTEESGSPSIPTLILPPELETRQVASLQEWRRERSHAAVSAALSSLENAAKGSSVNLMIPILDAVRAGATVGEISDALRSAFGTYQAE